MADFGSVRISSRSLRPQIVDPHAHFNLDKEKSVGMMHVRNEETQRQQKASQEEESQSDEEDDDKERSLTETLSWMA